jgi:hypothetical protein
MATKLPRIRAWNRSRLEVFGRDLCPGALAQVLAGGVHAADRAEDQAVVGVPLQEIQLPGQPAREHLVVVREEIDEIPPGQGEGKGIGVVAVVALRVERPDPPVAVRAVLEDGPGPIHGTVVQHEELEVQIGGQDAVDGPLQEVGPVVGGKEDAESWSHA